MHRTPTLIAAIVISAAAVAGCSSPPSCSTGSCASAEIQRSLVGDQAKDGAAITKAVCKAAVLDPGSTWTASCTVTESDGAVIRGHGNWFTGSRQVTFEVSAVVSPPS